MADAVAHGKVVLAGVIAGGGSLSSLDYLLTRGVTPEHFVDPVQQRLFRALVTYAERNGGVLSPSALGDALRKMPPGSAHMYAEAYAALAARAPERHEFTHSADQLRDLAAERATGDALAVGDLMLRQEVETPDGRKWYGHADAREYVLAEFAEAEQSTGTASPEGNVADDGAAVLKAYQAAKELHLAGHVPGIQLGIPSLDEYLGGGLRDGQLGIVMADTTAGKSSLCVHIAVYNAVDCGKNVVIFTTEQSWADVRMKVIARHSRHPKFGLRRGLNDADIMAGRLSPAEEKILEWVVRDLKTGGYGILHVVQMPELATVSGMAARYSVLRRQFRPDLCIADYLQLFSPERSRRDANMREDQSGVIKAAARWCAACDDGRGVPLLSPWQANGDGVNAQKTSGKYGLGHVSETKEAARTPGLVLALANPEEDESGGRAAPVLIQVLKNRGGPRGGRFPLTADYANSYFSDRLAGPGDGEFFDLDAEG
jgi:replicative DNA helicase